MINTKTKLKIIKSIRSIFNLIETYLSYSEIKKQVETEKINQLKMNFSNSKYSKNKQYYFPYSFENAKAIINACQYHKNSFSTNSNFNTEDAQTFLHQLSDSKKPNSSVAYLVTIEYNQCKKLKIVCNEVLKLKDFYSSNGNVLSLNINLAKSFAREIKLPANYFLEKPKRKLLELVFLRVSELLAEEYKMVTNQSENTIKNFFKQIGFHSVSAKKYENELANSKSIRD